jgi:hypothetical protein
LGRLMSKRVRITPAPSEQKGGMPRLLHQRLSESQVERCEHQNYANVHCQPFPESVSEEREIHTDDDGCHCYDVKSDCDLPAYFRLHGLYFKGKDNCRKTDHVSDEFCEHQWLKLTRSGLTVCSLPAIQE